MNRIGLLKGIGLIFRKEMWTAFRERRTLLFLFLFPLIVWPAFTLLPALLFGGKEKRAAEEASRVVLVAPDVSPQLDQVFAESDRVVLVEVEDIQNAVSDKEADCVVFVDSLSRDSMVLFSRIVYDATWVESKAAANKVELLFAQYDQQVVSQRLADQGVDEKLLTAVSSSRQNLIEQTGMLGFYLGMFVGMFIVMGSVLGGGSIIIDSTAGEKERKSLELLLTTPIPRAAIMMGKYLAGVTFGVISPILTGIGMSLAASFVLPVLISDGAGAGSVDLSILISADNILMILAAIVLLAAFVVAFLMAIAVRARSNKQAQTFLAPMNIVVVIPALFMNIIPAVPSIWMFLIPFMNVMLVIRGLIMDNLPRMAIVYTLGSSLVLLFIALRFAARGFGSEKVLIK